MIISAANWPYILILVLLIGGTLVRKVNMNWSQRADAPLKGLIGGTLGRKVNMNYSQRASASMQNKQKKNESSSVDQKMVFSKKAIISVTIMIVFYLGISRCWDISGIFSTFRRGCFLLGLSRGC
jgi:hypothetical protein